MDNTVRWSLKVSRETDEALRGYLGQTGGRKGDLSRFVQEAVLEKLKGWQPVARKRTPAGGNRAKEGLGEALREVRARTKGMSQARLEKLVAEAITYARVRR